MASISLGGERGGQKEEVRKRTKEKRRTSSAAWTIIIAILRRESGDTFVCPVDSRALILPAWRT